MTLETTANHAQLDAKANRAYLGLRFLLVMNVLHPGCIKSACLSIMNLNDLPISCFAVKEAEVNDDHRPVILECRNDGENQEFSSSAAVRDYFILMHSA